MVLDEMKLKKGKKLNKKYKNRKQLGTNNYQLNMKSSIIENHNLYLKDIEKLKSRTEKKKNKTKKKESKKIKIEKKKDLMGGILESVEHKENKENKKTIEIKEIKNEDIKNDIKQTGGKEIKENVVKNMNKKKLFISVDMTPDKKKNELII